MFATPMTVIVVLAVVICFAAGAGMIWRARRNRVRMRKSTVCPRCRASNPIHAKFCARCGEALG